MGEKSKVEFKCLLCGGNGYKEVRKKGLTESNPVVGPGDGGKYFPPSIDYYYCDDCSVMFKDLEKFNTVKK